MREHYSLKQMIVTVIAGVVFGSAVGGFAVYSNYDRIE